MAIDEKYGFPPIPTLRPYSPRIFSEDFHDLLLDALTESEKLWSKMEVEVFFNDGVVYLRVALDVGDRPLYLYLHPDGDVLQIDAPIFLDFPREASYFVLNELCGSTTNLSFRVDEKDVSLDECGKDLRPSMRKTNVLYGWRRCELDVFVESAHALLPFLVAKLSEAKKELRAFLDKQTLGTFSLMGPLNA